MHKLLLIALMVSAAIAVPIVSLPSSDTAVTTIPKTECTSWNYSSDKDDGQQAYGSNYMVENDVWNPIAIKQKLFSCNYDSFYVEANVQNNGGAVQSYPSSQYTFASPVEISKFSSLTSAFRFSDPPTGTGLDYEAAYDLWIDGYKGADHTEIMIWTYNHGQLPSGTRQSGTIAVGGHNFEVWKEGTPSQGGGNAVTFEATENYRSGETNLLSFLDYAANHGLLHDGTATPLWQIDYGAELCATNGMTKFNFTDFNVHFKD
jgi:Glycosyl hydrolase family 12